jgi:ATP-dependent RNA helicase DeaD
MLRVIERATRQTVEPMQLPTVEDVNERRVAKFNEKLTAAIGENAGRAFLPLIEDYERNNNVPAAEIAAALASIVQGATPLLMALGSDAGSQAGSDQPERPTRGRPPREESWQRREPRADHRSERPAHRSERSEHRSERPERSEHRPERAEQRPERSERFTSRPRVVEEAPAPQEEEAPRTLNRRERRALERAQQGGEGAAEIPTGEAFAERPEGEESPRPAKRRPSRDEAPARESRQSRDFSEDKAPRERISDDEVETYRIEVGEMHGIKPGNIVGAIANEAGLDGRSIGRVVIREDHSFVDLPAGMPKEMFRQLQKVRVGGQQLQISRALKTHVEKLRRERPSGPGFKAKSGRPAPKFKSKSSRDPKRGR